METGPAVIPADEETSQPEVPPGNAGNVKARKPEYIPTPEEIRSMCLMFQATWSPEEEMRRRDGQTRGYHYERLDPATGEFD